MSAENISNKQKAEMFDKLMNAILPKKEKVKEKRVIDRAAIRAKYKLMLIQGGFRK